MSRETTTTIKCGFCQATEVMIGQDDRNDPHPGWAILMIRQWIKDAFYPEDQPRAFDICPECLKTRLPEVMAR